MTGNGLNFRWNDPRPTAEFVICFVLHFLGPCDTADINHLFTSCWRKSPGHWIYLSFTVSFATWRSWSNPCFQSLQSPSESHLPKPRHLELSQHQVPTPNSVMAARGSGIGRHETFARGTDLQLLLGFRGAVGLLYAACHGSWRARVKTVRQRSIEQFGREILWKSWKWIEDHQEMDRLIDSDRLID